MKKIKLLTPLLISTTLTTFLPITSCKTSKEETSGKIGNVTNDEWHIAFDKIWDIDKERNFSFEGTMEAKGDFIQENIESAIITFKAKAAKYDNTFDLDEEIIYKDGKKVEDNNKINSTRSGLVDWQYVIDEEDIDILPTSTSLLGADYYRNYFVLYKFVGIFYSWYNSAQYIESSKEYKFNFINTDSLKLWISFNFNDESKLIEKQNLGLEVNVKDKFVGQIQESLTLKDYGSTTITVPDEVISTINKRTITTYLDNPSPTIPVHSVEDDEDYVYIFKPNETPTTNHNYNTITFNQCQFFEDEYEIRLNNTILTKNIDYTIEASEGNIEKITFFNEFTSNDTLIIFACQAFEKDDVTGKVTFEQQ